MKIIDNVGLPHIVKIVQDVLEDYDTSKLGNIYLNGVKLSKKNSKRYNPIWGMCYPPDWKKDGLNKYCIKCYVNTNDDVYPLRERHWTWIPSREHKSGRMSKLATWVFENHEEAALYLMAHEIFHYLAGTKQMFDRHGVLMRDLEANANWYANGIVSKHYYPVEIKHKI